MADKEISSLNVLEEKLDILVKRFEEQKGIIDSYVERERDWKKSKILQNKEIDKLKSKLSNGDNDD
jgi:chromosome condensin MukBEF ATPase and DNA-binding subunit MukB|tara:strand:+ start:476 stop:673 length:198 start_codon:yes stop_codon:yes gene_type:complete